MKRKVLVSRGYGAGWSSWSHEKRQEIAEYEPIIRFIEEGNRPFALECESFDPEVMHPLIKQMCEDLKLDGFYTGGAADLEVVEVEPPYRIEEYDGAEYVIEAKELWT